MFNIKCLYLITKQSIVKCRYLVLFSSVVLSSKKFHQAVYIRNLNDFVYNWREHQPCLERFYQPVYMQASKFNKRFVVGANITTRLNGSPKRQAQSSLEPHENSFSFIL